MSENKYNFNISVILVTYNAERFVVTALESVFANCDENVEVIVVDGKSTDRTLSIIGKYADKINTLVSESDLGIYDAMNKGIDIASGRFIYFIGADDILLCNLSNISSHLLDDNVIYYGDVLIAETQAIYGGEFKIRDIINRNICHQGIFFPAAALKRNKYDIRYKMLADYALNIKLWGQKRYKFEYINMLIAQYSIKGMSSTLKDNKFRMDSFIMVAKYLGIKGLFFKLLNPLRRVVYVGK